MEDHRRLGPLREVTPAGTAKPAPRSVHSKDGTEIGFLRVGVGPPLVIVHGSLGVADTWLAVANLLADRFTCYLMDRRGRGRSGDAPAYAIEREYEDVAAVFDQAAAAAPAGHVKYLLGHSYGAICALGAAREAPVDRLVLYEPPLGIDLSPAARDYGQAIAAGDPEKALEIGLVRIVGVPREQFDALRAAPIWPLFKALAPGWYREMQEVQRVGADVDRYRTLAMPVLLLLGSDTSDGLKVATAALAHTLINARVSELAGHGHAAQRTAPELVAQRIREFTG